MRRLIITLLMLTIVFTTRLLAEEREARSAANWPRFRGPNADGVADDDVRLPDSWDRQQNVKWARQIPGWGWSGPIVSGNKVVVTSVLSELDSGQPKKGLYLGQGVRTPPPGIHHWKVFCLDVQSGDILWEREPHTGYPPVPRHPKATYASETPCTDGERIYAMFGDVGLYCYDFDGKLLWSQPIEAKKTFFDYGAAASPIVHEGQVIIVYDNEEQPYIAAFDARTGQPRWRTERDERTTWATPFIWKNELRTEIVTCGFKKNRSYDLNGNLLWAFDGQMSNLVIPSPFAAHGLAYLASGYVGDRHRPVYAIRPGASGEFQLPEDAPEQSEFIAWYQPRASSYNPSPIVYGDYFYTLYDRGFLSCHDARTGEEVYGKRRFAPGATFTASPWAYNGKIFCLSEDGDTYVVQAGPEYALLQTNPLQELSAASPAVSQGRLFLRTASRLYCISNEAE